MTNQLILWHASRSDIEKPTVSGLVAGNTHANSGLGIYCATDKHSYIAGFGDHIHKMVIDPDARIKRITVGELREMGSGKDDLRDRQWFETERDKLSKDYDMLLVLETNGYASQAIILDDTIIKNSEQMTKDEFLAQAIFIHDSMAKHDRQKLANTVAMQQRMGMSF